MEKDGKVMQAKIHLIAIEGNRIAMRAASTKSHLRLSKALLRSSLRHIPGMPIGRWKLLTKSLERKILSIMDLPGMKADWLWLMIFDTQV